jgi:hypothetical protein
MRRLSDSGSIVGRIVFVLAVITVGFGVFVALKYVFLKDDGTPEATPTVTATASPALTPSANPTPTPTLVTFDGTWTGHVLGDLNTYDIEVVIDDDGTTLTGDVTYTWNPDRPGVDDCEGTWTQTSRHGRHADVHEVITSGPCIDEVDITLDMKPNGTVAFAVFYGNDYFPTAILTSE